METTLGQITRGSDDDRMAYRYAKAEQGYTGTWEDWCSMPMSSRIEYEQGASGGDPIREIIEAD